MDPAPRVIEALTAKPPDWDALRTTGVLDRIESACRRACRGANPEQADDVLSSVLLMLVADGGLMRLTRRHQDAQAHGEASDLLALVYTTALRRALDVLRPRYGDQAHARATLPVDLADEGTPTPREVVERVIGHAASEALARLVGEGLLDRGSADRWRSVRLAERLGVPKLSDMAAAWGTTEGALRIASQRTARRIGRLLAARGDDPIGSLRLATSRLGPERAVVLAVWSEACHDGVQLRHLDPTLPSRELDMDEVRTRYGVGSGRALGTYAASAFEALLAWSEEVLHG